MRTWMLASLLYAATAIGSDHSIESSSQFLDRVIAATPRANPWHEFSQLDSAMPARCCKVCTKGKPCGDTCIAQDKTCHVPPGCAC